MDGTTKAPAPSVLVVDDNADAVNCFRLLLQSHGHEVKVAYDGAQALVAIEKYRPDVVLLDLGLPMISGCEVARFIKGRNGTVPPRIVAVTGLGAEKDRKRTADAGFDLHLVKPVGEAQLLQAVGA